MNTFRQIMALVVAIAVCFAAAGIGSAFTAQSVSDWYKTIKRPSWTPPSWLFGPVWTLLYLTMAVAAWLVWRNGGFTEAPFALGVFVFQLALNALWAIIFFGMHNIGLALVELVVLWVAIIATIVLFWRQVTIAGIMLLPYAAWVSFAGALNFAIWRLNL